MEKIGIMFNIHDEISGREPKVGSVFFIAIDGRGGSGKTTLANILAEKLGAQIIHTDDFASWENPFDWWEAVIEKIFEPIKNGAKTLSYPRSKWWENHYPEPAENQPVTDTMILEGVGSFRKEFRDYISLGIFVDTPVKVCFERGIERDADTGKTKEELTQMWNEWCREEEGYLNRDNPKEYADIVLDGTKPWSS